MDLINLVLEKILVKRKSDSNLCRMVEKEFTMSEYHEVVLEVSDRDCIVDALKDLGFEPEVHEEAVPLVGYQGDKRAQKAHIVLPKAQVGGASNDIGFEKVNGKYVLRISSFDIGCKRFKEKEFVKNYKKHTVLKKIKRKRMFKKKSVTTTKDGKIVIRLKVS